MQLLHVSSEEGEQSGGGVAGRLTALTLQQLHQKVDVAHGQTQDLVLAQFLLRRMGGDELAELSEGRVNVVLAPTLPRVGEHLPGHGASVTGRRKLMSVREAQNLELFIQIISRIQPKHFLLFSSSFFLFFASHKTFTLNINSFSRDLLVK